MRPINLTGLGIKRMQESAEVGFINNAVLDRGGGYRATNLVVVPNHSGLRNVASFGRVDTVHMTHAFTVLGVLAVGDVNLLFVDHWGADHFITRLRPNGILGIKIKLPKLLSSERFVAANPAVALPVNYLHYSANRSHSRRTPLAVQNATLYG